MKESFNDGVAESEDLEGNDESMLIRHTNYTLDLW